jgi:hypothetical protein
VARTPCRAGEKMLQEEGKEPSQELEGKEEKKNI